MAKRREDRVALGAAVVVLAFLHFALRPVFDGWIARPNLLVCAVLIVALTRRPGGAAAVGFLLGLLEDAMGVSNFGLATLTLLLLGYLGSRTREQFVEEEWLFIGTYLFLGTWIYQGVSYLVLDAATDVLSHVLLSSPLDAIATTAVGYLVLPLVRKR